MEKSAKAVSALRVGRSGGAKTRGQQRLPNRTFQLSKTSYRYGRKLSDENAEIAEWLVRLTSNRRSRGFGLCFLYLCNLKGFQWNHKGLNRIYCELGLNLRIEPKKRLKRHKPDELAVPDAPSQTWSMDLWLINWRMGDPSAR